MGVVSFSIDGVFETSGGAMLRFGAALALCASVVVLLNVSLSSAFFLPIAPTFPGVGPACSVLSGDFTPARLVLCVSQKARIPLGRYASRLCATSPSIEMYILPLKSTRIPCCDLTNLRQRNSRFLVVLRQASIRADCTGDRLRPFR